MTLRQGLQDKVSRLIIEINDTLFFLSININKTIYCHLFHIIQKCSLNLNKYRILLVIKINGKIEIKIFQRLSLIFFMFIQIDIWYGISYFIYKSITLLWNIVSQIVIKFEFIFLWCLKHRSSLQCHHLHAYQASLYGCFIWKCNVLFFFSFT